MTDDAKQPPVRIFVNVFDSEDGCCPVEHSRDGDGKFYRSKDAVEYVQKATIPRDLQDAMAQIEALRRELAAQEAVEDALLNQIADERTASANKEGR